MEYLVVVYNEDDPSVLLSLRQAEILKALASDSELTAKGGGVPDLQDGPLPEYAESRRCGVLASATPIAVISLYRPHRDVPTRPITQECCGTQSCGGYKTSVQSVIGEVRDARPKVVLSAFQRTEYTARSGSDVP